MNDRLTVPVKEEGGFTLPEMMVTIMVMITIFFALYNIFDMSIRVFSFGNDKVEAVENARIGLERMEREVRAAYPYDKGNPSSSDARLFDAMGAEQVTFANDLGAGDRVIDQATEEITYSLSGSSLQRAVGTGQAQPVADFVTGLNLRYLKRSGIELVAAASESEVEVVRISLTVTKDGIEQSLTTDVDLRSRG